jgi:hypothetical protein
VGLNGTRSSPVRGRAPGLWKRKSLLALKIWSTREGAGRLRPVPRLPARGLVLLGVALIATKGGAIPARTAKAVTPPTNEARPSAPSAKPSATSRSRASAPAKRTPPHTRGSAAGKPAPSLAKSSKPLPPPRPAATLAKSSKPLPPPRPHENAYLEVPERAFAESTLAFRYANLSDEEAKDELVRRGIAWLDVSPPPPGVRTPIRLAAPLRGVSIHSTLPPAERASSPFEILDARLALALDDFCALLARHDVVELVHFTMYRPPTSAPAEGQRPIRHPAGLAIDVGALRKRDGSWLSVRPHWPSNIGARTCGEGAVEHSTREARELSSIVCQAMEERLFHFALTPDFDAAHADHVHLEIKPDTRWFIVN